MDCPPPLSSDDEDDDFGDFSTFEKTEGAKGGSIKSRIHLDTPLSPEPGDSPSFPIPPKHADFSIDSDSSPPELPPSLPMSPETPDVDFFSRTRGSSPPPFHFTEKSSSASFSENQNNDLFSTDLFVKSSAASHASKTDDFFADFASPEKNNLPTDDDFFPFKSIESHDTPEDRNSDDNFTDFSAPVSVGITEGEVENSSEVTDKINTEPDKFSAKIDHANTSLSDIVPEEVVTAISSAEDTCKSDNSLDQALVNPSIGDEDTPQEVASLSQAKEEEFVPNLNSETPSPVKGGKSVFSWDSFEENVDTVVDNACEKKTDDFFEDKSQDDAMSTLKDGSDNFHGFANFDSKVSDNIMDSDQPNLDSYKDDLDSETDLDFFTDKNEEKSRSDNDNVGSDSQDESNRLTWNFQSEENENKDETSKPTENFSEKVTSDQFDDITKEETNNSTQKEDLTSCESFGNLEDLGTPSGEGELSTSADLKNTGDEKDFGAYNEMVSATTAINDTVNETADHDGLGDDFGDFGAFDNEKPSAASDDEKPSAASDDEKPSEASVDGLGDNFCDFGAFDNDEPAKSTDDGLGDNLGDFGAFDNDEPASTADDGLGDNFGDFGAFDNDEPAKSADDGFGDNFGDFGAFDNDEPAKSTDEGLGDNFGDFGAFDNDKPVRSTDEGLDDDFGDFGAFDNDKPVKSTDDDFGDFGAFDNDKPAKTADDGLDDDFGDFGAFDNDKPAKTADDGLDDDFDDFADFGSASQKPDPKPPVKSKSQPLSLSKVIKIHNMLVVHCQSQNMSVRS